MFTKTRLAVFAVLALLVVVLGVYIVHSRSMISSDDFLHTVNNKLTSNQNLSDEEIQRLQTLGLDKNRDVRAKAITSLSYAKGPKANQATLNIAKVDLSDREWLIRLGALGALRRSHAPERYALAKQMLSDPSARVRKEAEVVLSDKSP